MLCSKMDELRIRIEYLSAQLEQTDSQNLNDEIIALTKEMEKLNDQLSNFQNGKVDDE